MMKRNISIILIICLSAALLCGCGSRDSRTGVDNGGSFADNVTVVTPEPSQTPAAIVTAAPVPVETAAPSATPGASAIPVATPAPTSSIYVVNTVSITKNPTAETVSAGGDATFIARAVGNTSIVWILVSPDAKTVYNISDAPGKFSGLTVSGQGTETLKLTSIPQSMDGWGVQCYFTDSTGERFYTTRAKLTVKAAASAEETKAKELATACWNKVKTYADTYGFAAGEVTWLGYTDGRGEFSIPMTRTGTDGEVILYATFKSNPAANSYYPVDMQWTQNNTGMGWSYYEESDTEIWTKFGNDIREICQYYGWVQ